MRTADADLLESTLDQRLKDLANCDAKIFADSDEIFQLKEEKRVLTESLDRSKDAIAAVIEQREKLAAKLREAKR